MATVTANGARPVHVGYDHDPWSDEVTFEDFLLHLPQTAEELHPGYRDPEFDLAIKDRHVTFAQLARAHGSREETRLAVPVVNATLVYRKSWHMRHHSFVLYHAALRSHFTRTDGWVVKEAFLSLPTPCLAILTSKGEIRTHGGPLERPEVFGLPERAVLFNCLQLARDARLTLRSGPGLIACMDYIFTIVVLVLNLLASDANTPQGANQERAATQTDLVPFLQGRYEDARRVFAEAAARDAQRMYLIGSLLGIFPIAVIVGLLALLANTPNNAWRVFDTNDIVIPATALIAGAVGAIISVFQRLASGTLTVRNDGDRGLIRFLGSFRPVVGAIFGVLIFVLVRAKLMPFIAKPDGSSDLYFFLSLAFVAGFSERFAQDILARTTQGLTNEDRKPRARSASPPGASVGVPLSSLTTIYAGK
jgi:hypothetical protein